MKNMKNIEDCKDWSYFAVRVLIGIMFIFAGYNKLMNPNGTIIKMLSTAGFPIAEALGWLVILSELIFGIFLLVGWKVKYTVYPLIIILLVATALILKNSADLMVTLRSAGLYFHLITVAVMLYISANGPGKWNLDKK